MADHPTAVRFDAVDIVFGDAQKSAIPLLERGEDRETILAETGQVLGVAGANLAVRRGELFVLMGLSGSGKSTLLRAVNRLNSVTRGRILIEDNGETIDVTSCPRRELRRLRNQKIAFVFQQFALLPWRTVAENVAFGLELRGMPKAEREARAREMLDLVDLSAWGDKHTHELSGGMQQRVGLARAFATDADILLMDEPFSALDPLIRTALQDELLELQRRLGKTILFVSHDLDEAIKIGNRIAIMEGGRIVQCGTAESIVTSPSNDYVKRFVGAVNPLSVLTAGAVMAEADGASWSEESRAIDAISDGAPPGAVACAVTTPLRRLVGLAAVGHGPFVIQNESGETVGLIDQPCLLAAIA